MHAKVEGILISKMPYRERDILGKLLLRNGQKITVLFRNGRGGKRNKKTLCLELGYFLKTEISKSNIVYKEDDFFCANDWSLTWYHQKIRENIKAFYLMCVFLELGLKISLTASVFSIMNESIIFSNNNLKGEGVFNILSNALFFLEDSLIRNNLNVTRDFLLFIVKLLYIEGVGINLKECVYCKNLFTPVIPTKMFAVRLVPKEGGFCCNICSEKLNIKSNHQIMIDTYTSVKQAVTTKYKNYSLLHVKNSDISQSNASKILFNYFCYQFHFSRSEFKSIKSLW
ncbi:MAG: hypothetical protein HQK51_09120 [Oligoflexia bacterium]|nr:hypothetical protein [Oligoflexia bacterium]